MLVLFSLRLSDALETDLQKYRDINKMEENVRQAITGLYNNTDSNKLRNRWQRDRGRWRGDKRWMNEEKQSTVEWSNACACSVCAWRWWVCPCLIASVYLLECVPSGRALLIFSTVIRLLTSLLILWATPGYWQQTKRNSKKEKNMFHFNLILKLGEITNGVFDVINISVVLLFIM